MLLPLFLFYLLLCVHCSSEGAASLPCILSIACGVNDNEFCLEHRILRYFLRVIRYFQLYQAVSVSQPLLLQAAVVFLRGPTQPQMQNVERISW